MANHAGFGWIHDARFFMGAMSGVWPLHSGFPRGERIAEERKAREVERDAGGGAAIRVFLKRAKAWRNF